MTRLLGRSYGNPKYITSQFLLGLPLGMSDMSDMSWLLWNSFDFRTISARIHAGPLIHLVDVQVVPVVATCWEIWEQLFVHLASKVVLWFSKIFHKPNWSSWFSSAVLNAHAIRKDFLSKKNNEIRIVHKTRFCDSTSHQPLDRHQLIATWMKHCLKSAKSCEGNKGGVRFPRVSEVGEVLWFLLVKTIGFFCLYSYKWFRSKWFKCCAVQSYYCTSYGVGTDVLDARSSWSRPHTLITSPWRWGVWSC